MLIFGNTYSAYTDRHKTKILCFSSYHQSRFAVSKIHKKWLTNAIQHQDKIFSYEKNERIVRSRANSFLAFFSANFSVVKFDFSTKKHLKSEKTAKKDTDFIKGDKKPLSYV